MGRFQVIGGQNDQDIRGFCILLHGARADGGVFRQRPGPALKIDKTLRIKHLA
jgi:hypothetical protein